MNNIYSISMNKYIIIPICFIGFSILIKLYNDRLKKKYGNNYACKDVLNKILLSFLTLKGCIWNLMHIFIYFGLWRLISKNINP